MIRLTKLNGKSFILNADLIETVEDNPDTTISTSNGKKFVVLETVDQVIESVIEFRKSIGIFGFK